MRAGGPQYHHRCVRPMGLVGGHGLSEWRAGRCIFIHSYSGVFVRVAIISFGTRDLTKGHDIQLDAKR